MAFDVFSKVRCPSPNRKDTAIKNYKHVFYISNRTHCLKNEYGSTLFGTLYDFDNLNTTKNSMIANYIYQQSLKGTNIYRGVISLSEKDAIMQGYTDRKAWETMLNESIEKIANHLGINFCSLEWIATVHYKKGNPHLHYVLWDREQKIKNPFITVHTQCKIRNLLKKNIYKEYYNELIQAKNKARDNLRSKEILEEFKSIDKNYCSHKIAYINISHSLRKELQNDLKTIESMLPSSGSFKYAYMSDEVKTQIDNFVDKLIENNFDCKKSYENYISSWNKIVDFYKDNYSKEKLLQADIEVHKILGNQLLQYIKNEEYLSFSIENLMQEFYYLLTEMEDSEESFLQRYVFNKDLSIYAKKEYAFKNKFSNYIGSEM